MTQNLTRQNATPVALWKRVSTARTDLQNLIDTSVKNSNDNFHYDDASQYIGKLDMILELLQMQALKVSAAMVLELTIININKQFGIPIDLRGISKIHMRNQEGEITNTVFCYSMEQEACMSDLKAQFLSEDPDLFTFSCVDMTAEVELAQTALATTSIN